MDKEPKPENFTKDDQETGRPLQYVLSDGRILGLFFGSYDRKNHLAQYVPFKSPPTNTICGAVAGHLTGARSSDNLCEDCFNLAGLQPTTGAKVMSTNPTPEQIVSEILKRFPAVKAVPSFARTAGAGLLAADLIIPATLFSGREISVQLNIAKDEADPSSLEFICWLGHLFGRGTSPLSALEDAIPHYIRELEAEVKNAQARTDCAKKALT